LALLNEKTSKGVKVKRLIELKMGELFSGAGGLALGAQNAKAETELEIYNKIKLENR